MINETLQTKNHELFDKLVPDFGTAPTLGGEILRAVNRIAYRFFNDGDRAWLGYGRETVNPAVRFLNHILHHGVPATAQFKATVEDLFETTPNEEDYEALVDAMVEAGLETIVTFNLGNEKNFVGAMEDYANPKEDCDFDDEEEEWEDDEDDEWADEEDEE